jgi:hypothetical protein
MHCRTVGEPKHSHGLQANRCRATSSWLLAREELDVLVNALLAGTPADRIKDHMAQQEARQKQLEKELTKLRRLALRCASIQRWPIPITLASSP